MKIVTHNGKFHADDIFAVATLLLIYPDAEVVRTRDEDVIKSGDIVVDVGFAYDPQSKRFDHHQAGGAGERGNGIPYSSFGLVWKEFGERIAGGTEEASLIDNKLVSPVDAHDNGVEVSVLKFEGVREYTISDFFYSVYNTTGDGDDKLLEAFMQSVEMAQALLKREIQITQKQVRDAVEVQDIFDRSTDKRIIVLDTPLSWFKTLVSKPEPIYVIYPREEGNWGVRAIPKKLIGYEMRKPLPESWGGKKIPEIREVTGVSDAIFCHRSLFICSAETKEGAIALAHKALEA